MTSIFLIILVVVLFVGLLFIGRLLGVEYAQIGKLFYFKFFPRRYQEQDLQVSPLFKIDPVISKDGKIYKVHLVVSVMQKKEISVSNWSLNIRGLRRMTIKKYFLIHGPTKLRAPIELPASLPIETDKEFVLGLEFEPEDGYVNPIEFREGIYPAVLRYTYLGKAQKLKFRFLVRAQDLKSIKKTAKTAQEKGVTFVHPLPILT